MPVGVAGVVVEAAPAKAEVVPEVEVVLGHPTKEIVCISVILVSARELSYVHSFVDSNSTLYIQVTESINEISSVPLRNLAGLWKYGNQERSQHLHLSSIVRATMRQMLLKLRMECKLDVIFKKIIEKLDYRR